MPQQTNRPFLPLLGGLFALSAIALVAMVLTRSYAASYTDTSALDQQIQAQAVAMTLDSQTLTQGGVDVAGINNATPSNKVHLTSGTMSDPIQLQATITNVNGVNQVLMGQANAHLRVYAVYGSSQQSTDCTVLSYDGTKCWGFDMNGDLFADKGTVVPLTNNLNETHATITVPIQLPYYALPGTWTIYWQLIPTTPAGVANPSYALDNTGVNKLQMEVDRLVAIDVSANSGATALYTAKGDPIVPGDISDAVSIHVYQKGNVTTHVKVFGTDWSNGLGMTMPVSITHFLGAKMNNYTPANYQTLVSGDANTAIQIHDDTGAEWLVDLSTGDQDGIASLAAESVYDTRISPSAGSSGSYTATLTNIAADANQNSGGGGGGASSTIQVLGQTTDIGVKDMVVNGNYAYVTRVQTLANGGGQNNVNNFSVIDMTDKQNPSVVGTLSVGYFSEVIASKGNYVYLAHNSIQTNMTVIDVSDPANPFIAGYAPMPGQTASIHKSAVFGNELYVVHGGGTMWIIDVTDPSSPTFLASVALDADGSIDSIVKFGNYLYASDPMQGVMNIVNVSLPADPTVVTTQFVPESGDPNMLAVVGNYLYVGVRLPKGSTHEAIDVYSLDSPTNPIFVTSLALNDGLSQPNFAVTGSRLAAVSPTMLTLIDVTSPESPSIMTTTSALAISNDTENPPIVSASGQYVFVGKWKFSVVDLGAN